METRQSASHAARQGEEAPDRDAGDVSTQETDEDQESNGSAYTSGGDVDELVDFLRHEVRNQQAQLHAMEIAENLCGAGGFSVVTELEDSFDKEMG